MQSNSQHNPHVDANEADRTSSVEQQHGMSSEELAQQETADLPERDAMSLVNLNAAIPVNAAIAANVLSDGSTAQAAAIQQTPITQGI